MGRSKLTPEVERAGLLTAVAVDGVRGHGHGCARIVKPDPDSAVRADGAELAVTDRVGEILHVGRDVVAHGPEVLFS